MREHGVDHDLRIALRAQDRRAVLRVLVERGVDLVVEVVEQRGDAPELLVLSETGRIRGRRGLHGERVAQQSLTLGVVRQRRPGLLAGHRHDGASIVRLVASTVVRPTSESFVIEGGHPLSGRVRASGNKNGALPILAACLLTDEPVTLSNVPRIRDVETMLGLLAALGADAEWTGVNELRVHAHDVGYEVDDALASQIRASFLLAGPLLARHGRAVVPPPGGDVIGRRRLDPHFHAFGELGAELEYHDRYDLSGTLTGAHIHLDEASVMATENAVMAATLTPGDTMISNAASEPHVQDLCRFLISLGADITGVGSNVLHVTGVEGLHGGAYAIGLSTSRSAA